MKSPIRCYAKPYEGSEPYIFFSYCHEDESIVFSMIERLAMEGFRVWYDDGIHPGDDWLDIIAEHIEHSDCCIAAISYQTTQSHNCKKELAHCIGNRKKLVPVILEKFVMPGGLKLQLADCNYIEKDSFPDIEDLFKKLMSSDAIKNCRGKTGMTAENKIIWKEHAAEYAKQPSSGSSVVSSGKKTPELKLDPKYRNELDEISKNVEALFDRTIGVPRGSKNSALKQIMAEIELYLNHARNNLAELQKLYDRSAEVIELEEEYDKIISGLEDYQTYLRTVAPPYNDQEKKLTSAKNEIAAIQEQLEDFSISYEDIMDMSVGKGHLSEKKIKRLTDLLNSLTAFQERISNAVSAVEALDNNQPLLNKLKAVKDKSDEIILAVNDEIELLSPKSILVHLSTGNYYQLGTQGIRIGRKPSAGGAVINNDSVSKEHFSITCKNGKYYLSDLNSTFGTQLNGADISSEVQLQDSCRITAGIVDFQFYPGTKAKQLLSERKLTILTGRDFGEIHVLEQTPVFLDRSKENAKQWRSTEEKLVLKDMHIHRKGHAKLFPKDGKWFVAHINIPENDEIEPNPTYLNGTELSQPYGEGNAAELHAGDRITVYNTDFIFSEITLQEVKI